MRQKYYSFVVRAEGEGADRHFLSLVPPDHAFRNGLPPQAILGEVFGADFAPNPEFVRFVHQTHARFASECPALVAEARRQREGFIFILDGRTPTPGDEVPPHDILGAVSVSSGVIQAYEANPQYMVLAESGLMDLDGWWHERLIRELCAL